jgi:hypothetical protein
MPNKSATKAESLLRFVKYGFRDAEGLASGNSSYLLCFVCFFKYKLLNDSRSIL